MPTPVDLVTDLPADFEVFGQAVDSSLADLKGGTSGQILSKNSNTDMDFVWITNDVGDITAVTAGTGISGGGSSGAVTITNSMATEIAAKGDLIAGTGSQTFDNLTVGANGTVLVADSSASTGLKYAPAGNWHGARVIKTTTQTLANNVEVAITFDNEIYDTDGYHDNTTNNTRCTVPTGLGGIYLVTGYITYDSNATGARYVVLTKNGGIDAYSVIDASGSGETMFVTSQIIALAAGDFIELKGIQTSGGNLGIKGGQVFYSGLSLALIGA
jgi:DNA-binding beta-propeller fold protein YncE